MKELAYFCACISPLGYSEAFSLAQFTSGLHSVNKKPKSRLLPEAQELSLGKLQCGCPQWEECV